MYWWYLILGLTIYLLYKTVFKLVVKMLYLKWKYGEQVEIYYFPLMGIFQLFNSGKEDVAENIYFKYQKKNPKMKVLISNLGNSLYYQLNDPEMIGWFSMNQDNYKKMGDFLFSPDFFSDGLFMTHQDQWKRQRKFLSPLFTHESINSRQGAINYHSNQLIECLKFKEESRVHLLKTIGKATGDIVCDTFFGQEIIKEELNNQPISYEIQSLIDEIMNHSLESVYFFLRNLFIKGCSKDEIPEILLTKHEKWLWSRVSALRELVLKIIDSRISTFKENEPINDFLHHHIKEYLKNKKEFENTHPDSKFSYDSKQNYELNKDKYLQKEEILKQFIAIYFAGQDTTAHLVLIALYHLSKNEEFQQKIREEIKSIVKNNKNIEYEETKQFTLLSQFIQESLRYHSPASSSLTRVTLSDHKISNWFEIKQGEYVDANFLGNFKNQKYFDSPDQFKPERFSDMKKVDQKSFTPFFSGPHNCIGQHMALLEARIILSKLILNFNILPRPDYQLKMTFSLLYEPVDKQVAILKEIIE